MQIISLLLILILFIEFGYSQTTKWKVIWDKNPEQDIKEYIVYKDNKEIARVKSPDTVFVDEDIIPGTLYIYRIRAVNMKAQKGELSDPAEAAIPGFKNLPPVLGISKDKPTKLFLKDYINDPDDSTHEIKRINIPLDSKTSVSLQNGNLIFAAKSNWTEPDSEIVEIEVKDSHEFSNNAKFLIKDESVVGENLNIPPDELNIEIDPSEFILSQYSEIRFSGIPQNCKISIYDSFDNLVFSEDDISDVFFWDAENTDGDQVLFGLYYFVLYNKADQMIFKKPFRVTP